MQSGVSRLSRPFYLANVLSIAKVDGAVPPPASKALQSIIKRIGASDQDLADAARLLASGKYKVHLSREPSESMSNLQDMVMVALADGNVSPREAAPIERAAKVMDFSQADMDMAVRRAELALKQMGVTDVLPSKPPPVPATAPPPPAPKRPRSTMPLESPPAATPVVPLEPEIKPEIEPELEPEPVVVSEAPPVPPPVMTHPAAPVTAAGGGQGPARVKACAACRESSEEGTAYCFGRPEGALNVWGCRLAGMDWAPGAMWMELGHFQDDETFVFDKQAIADRLGANLAGVLECPHLSVAYTEKTFDMLPSKVAVRGHWRYREAETGDPESITLHVTEYVHGCPVADVKQVSGIEPIGTREAEKVIRKALRAAGRSDVDVQALRAS